MPFHIPLVRVAYVFPDPDPYAEEPGLLCPWLSNCEDEVSEKLFMEA